MGDQRGFRRLKIKVRGSRPLQLEIGLAGLDAERLLVELYSLWLNSLQS